jgi:hypothetical protein
VGVVVKIHPDAPLRPVIRVLVTKEGKKLAKEENKLINLREDQKSFIARPFDPKATKL